MMRGNITRRGKSSWRLKFDVCTNPASGQRQTRYVTVRGKRQDAERELARLLNEAHNGTLIEPSKVTVAEYLRTWLNSAHGLSPKTAERYRQLAEQQIIPHLGAVQLQKLKPSQVQDWHSVIMRGGGKDGRPLSSPHSGSRASGPASGSPTSSRK
jgi:integrase